MRDRLIDSLEILEVYGRRRERQKDLDGRCASPAPAEKMHVVGAAYSGPTGKAKISSVWEMDEVDSDEEVAAVQESVKTKDKLKKKDQPKQEKSAGKKGSKERSAAEPTVGAVTIPERRYADVVQSLPAENNAWRKASVGPSNPSGPIAFSPVRGSENRQAGMLPIVLAVLFRQHPTIRGIRYLWPQRFIANGGGARTDFVGICYAC